MLYEVITDLDHVRIVGGGDQKPVRRDDPDQLPERLLEVGKVPVDVGVVELDAGEQADAGAVVEELRPFVEVRGVVFVSFA